MRYRLQRHDGTDCSATMVPIAALQWYRLQCYAWYRFSAIVRTTLLRKMYWTMPGASESLRTKSPERSPSVIVLTAYIDYLRSSDGFVIFHLDKLNRSIRKAQLLCQIWWSTIGHLCILFVFRCIYFTKVLIVFICWIKSFKSFICRKSTYALYTPTSCFFQKI